MLKVFGFTAMSLAAAAAAGAALVIARWSGGVVDVLLFLAAGGLVVVATAAAWLAQDAAIDDFAEGVMSDHVEAHYDQGF